MNSRRQASKQYPTPKNKAAVPELTAIGIERRRMQSMVCKACSNQLRDVPFGSDSLFTWGA